MTAKIQICFKYCMVLSILYNFFMTGSLLKSYLAFNHLSQSTVAKLTNHSQTTISTLCNAEKISPRQIRYFRDVFDMYGYPDWARKYFNVVSSSDPDSDSSSQAFDKLTSEILATLKCEINLLNEQLAIKDRQIDKLLKALGCKKI